MILIGELMKKYILGLLLIIIVTVIIILSKYYLFKNNTDSPNNNLKFYNPSYKQRYNKYKKQHSDLSFKEIVTQVNIGLDYSFYTHTKKTPYLNKNYILVNKYLYLSSNYVPSELESLSRDFARNGMRLVKSAKSAFENMARDALEDNIKIIAMSSYRDYQYQVNLYNNYVKNDGVRAADTYSARPGYSEHQTGLCVDVYDGIIDYTNFEQSESFQWMKKNAYKYGFILRYPKGKEYITGYQYESWHYRYVGKKIANYIYKHNLTFDEYYVQQIENNY